MPLAAAFMALAQAGAVPPPAAPKCASHEPSAIVVCGAGPQPYGIDPDVSAGQRAADHDANSATASIPAAQAACAYSPMGCGKGLEGLDLINLAMLAGTMAVNAATGRDWARPLRPAGPGEYQRYQEAKQKREERSADLAARRLRDEARKAAGQD